MASEAIQKFHNTNPSSECECISRTVWILRSFYSLSLSFMWHSYLVSYQILRGLELSAHWQSICNSFSSAGICVIWRHQSNNSNFVEVIFLSVRTFYESYFSGSLLIGQRKIFVHINLCQSQTSWENSISIDKYRK